MGDCSMSVHCSVNVKNWSLKFEFLGAKSKSGYHCMVNEAFCGS